MPHILCGIIFWCNKRKNIPAAILRSEKSLIKHALVRPPPLNSFHRRYEESCEALFKRCKDNG